MDKNCVFTICAKNFLPYAFSLEKSIKQFEPNIDFYIFLADEPNDSITQKNIIYLNNDWIPNYINMAFKYDVIEFSTSIKPFCFNYLNKLNYEKIIYFDPDILIFDSLHYIFEKLNNFDIVLTPHVCEILKDGNHLYKDEWYLRVGVFNLGFVAIKNSIIGNKIIDWWMYQLENKCFENSDNNKISFVDQKWMMFIPAYFPNNCYISDNLGMNIAHWNLHERFLFKEDNDYWVSNYNETKKNKLLFYHFSHYDIKSPEYLIRHNYSIKLTEFKHIEDLYKLYRKNVLDSHYDEFIKLTYNYNFFSNKQPILKIHRRLFYTLQNEIKSNPFDCNNEFYILLKKNHLLLKETKNNTTNKIELNPYKIHNQPALRLRFKILLNILYYINKFFGVQFYSKNVIATFKRFSMFEEHDFLIRKK